MNRIFGGLLRAELTTLVNNSLLLRPRAVSTGSRRISSDSNEGVDEMSDQEITLMQKLDRKEEVRRQREFTSAS
jgi:hypothetical protein